MPRMNYKETISTRRKDLQYKSEQQRTGKVKTTSIIKIIINIHNYILHSIVTSLTYFALYSYFPYIFCTL